MEKYERGKVLGKGSFGSAILVSELLRRMPVAAVAHAAPMHAQGHGACWAKCCRCLPPQG